MVGVADSMMVGRLGAETLAAASLANSIFFVVMMFGIGVSMAITPLVAAADGEGKSKRIARVFKHGFVINAFSGGVLFLIIMMAAPGLYYLNQPIEVVNLAIPYLGIITLSLIPFMFFQTFKQFTEGLSQTRQAMAVTIFCNVINVFLNWIMIYGHLGFPAMGLNGAGWATLISRILMGLMIFYYVWNSRRYQSYKIGFGFKKLSFPLMSKMLQIGVPTGLQFIFEVGASYHAKLDPEKIGLGVSTFVLVGLIGHNKSHIEAFMKEVNNIQEIIECHHITGTGDFILKIISKDITAYQKLMLEKVSEIKEVDSMQSMVILSTFKDSKVLPVPA
jgi:MATE family multidrug resistance protein